jgi:hypothetical protein
VITGISRNLFPWCDEHLDLKEMAVFRRDAPLKDPHARSRTYSGLVFSSEAGS